jgi:hypothetical protein
LLGDWKNVDSNTGGIVRIMITEAGGTIKVQVWGACTPIPCDWGVVKAVPYGPNIRTPLPAEAEYLQADYSPTLGQNTVLIGPVPRPGGELRTINLTRFTDNSGRSDVANTYLFRK